MDKTEKSKTIVKAYKFRIYPDEAQRAYFAMTFGCCRLVYNHFLAIRMFAYAQKRGIADLDELLESGFDTSELDRVIEVEEGHFGYIAAQSIASVARDARTLRDYRPVEHCAYWRWALEHGHAERGVKVPGFFDTSKALTSLKKEVVDKEGGVFLYDADAVALVYELRHLDAAYQNFFRRVKQSKPGENPGYPRFKRKSDDRHSFTTAGKAIVLDYESRRVKLPKAGWVDCVPHRELEGRIVSATVSLDNAGRYFVSLQCDGVPLPEAPSREKVPEVGVELGVARLAVLSDGTVFDGEHMERIKALQRRLVREEAKLARKQGAKAGEEKSARFLAQQEKVRKLRARIADIKSDALHNISHEIASSYDTIYIHDHDLAEMKKNKRESRDELRLVEKRRHKNMDDAGMGELRRQIAYKSGWLDGTTVVIDSKYPSTQRCSACGYINKELAGVEGLKVRKWTCPECGAEHERDYNSANNVLDEGRRIVNEGIEQ